MYICPSVRTCPRAQELDFRLEATSLRVVGANMRAARVVARLPLPVQNLVTQRVLVRWRTLAQMWGGGKQESGSPPRARWLGRWLKGCILIKGQTGVSGVLEMHSWKTRKQVMNYCDGISLKSSETLANAGIDCSQLVARVCDAWACQILQYGVFNADPHPGNLLAQLDKEYGSVPVLLDFGMTKVHAWMSGQERRCVDWQRAGWADGLLLKLGGQMGRYLRWVGRWVVT
eukprot:6211315-Pleurochrysis_carterae.AAC.1